MVIILAVCEAVGSGGELAIKLLSSMTIVADGLLGLAWLGFAVVSLGRLILEGAVGLIATVELLRSQPFKLKAQIVAKPIPFILLFSSFRIGCL